LTKHYKGKIHYHFYHEKHIYNVPTWVGYFHDSNGDQIGEAEYALSKRQLMVYLKERQAKILGSVSK
jgi:hypothetical protein